MRTKKLIYDFIIEQKLAVITTISEKGKPEAALMGIAVTEKLEIIFDTVKSSRKYPNLISNPLVALVIGWKNEATVQYEGRARELKGSKSEKLKEIYFSVFPEGRERAQTWPDIAHFIIRPTWIRYSDFSSGENNIREMDFSKEK